MIRSRHPVFEVVAEQVEQVTPHMRRITLDASCLAPFREGLPAQWLKVFPPDVDAGRAYTIRRFAPDSKRLDLDFVLHGDEGPASAWASRVSPGDGFGISQTHPRSGFAIAPSVRSYLFFGDETALPAISAILEALPAAARAEAVIEVADAAEEQRIDSAAKVDLTWLHRAAAGTGHISGLKAAAKAIARPGNDTVVWIAAESSIVAELRKLAVSDWGIDRSRLHAAGYWKRGEARHRDPEAAGEAA